MSDVVIMSDCIYVQSRQLTRSRGRPAGNVWVVEFDPCARILHRDGKVFRRLTPQQATILQLLVQNVSTAVPLQAIEQHLWPSRSPINGSQRIREIINELRESLVDSPDTRRWIETVPGVGYMFVGTVLDAPPPPPIARKVELLALSTLSSPQVTDLSVRQAVTVECETSEGAEPYSSAVKSPSLLASSRSSRRDLFTFGTWNQYWPIASLLMALAIIGTATATAAYGLGVIGFCAGIVFGIIAYTRLRDSASARAALGILIVAGMSYIPSAATLQLVMGTVVNITTIPPALVYPFVTGLKFIPLYVLVFAYWSILGLFSDKGFAANPILGKTYVVTGIISLGMTGVALIEASGDYEIWIGQLPGRWHLLIGYAVVFGINLIVWIRGYRIFEKTLQVAIPAVFMAM